MTPTGDSPTLPLHPHSARITTLIRSSPSQATPERLAEVECELFLRVNGTEAEAERKWEARFGKRKRRRRGDKGSVRVRRGDGLVRFGDAESKFWLGGREVVAYECR